MIGKRQNLTKPFLSIAIVFSTSLGYSQASFEAKAVEYFCANILKIDPTLKEVDIVFKGAVEARSSKVYDIADCLGNIDLIKGEVPNKVLLDSLEEFFSKVKYDSRELGVPCEALKRSVCRLFKRSVLDMSLYHAVKYSDKTHVEIFLHDRKQQTYRIVVITFDGQDEVSGHCLNFITYD